MTNDTMYSDRIREYSETWLERLAELGDPARPYTTLHKVIREGDWDATDDEPIKAVIYKFIPIEGVGKAMLLQLDLTVFVRMLTHEFKANRPDVQDWLHSMIQSIRLDQDIVSDEELRFLVVGQE